MRSLSIVAVALLGTALSTANAQQVKRTNPAPTKGQHTTLKSATGTTQLSPLLGMRNPNPVNKPAVAKNGSSHHSFVAGGTDACGAGTPIAGFGTFLGDNIGATTDGPSNCGGLGSDVWYTYTATATGPIIVSMCALAGYDTAISVYDTAACTGPLLACNDDTCAFQSQVQVPVVAGSVYKIQIGGFSGAQGSYQMDISAAPTCPCGPDTEGEGAPCGIPVDMYNGGCNSTPNVYSVLTCGGSVCGNGAFDGTTRDTDWYTLALGPGAWQVDWSCTAEFTINTGILTFGCPPNILNFVFGTGPCSATLSTVTGIVGPTTLVLFAAPAFASPIPCGAGDTYTGNVVCTPVAPPGPCDTLDDGSSENAVGFAITSGTDIMWLQQGGSPGVSVTLDAIETCWGTLAFPGNGPPGGVGSIERIGLWTDSDGGDPTTGLTSVINTSSSGLGGIDVVVGNLDNDTFDHYDIPRTVVTGTYWVGASSEGAFPSPLDQTSGSTGGRSWIVGSTTGATTIDYNNLGGATVPPLNEDNVAAGAWMLRPDCDIWGGPVEYECFGDGSATDDGGPFSNCPCGAPPGNIGAPGHGCRNSNADGLGALLTATGSTSISGNNMRFTMVNHRVSATNVTLVWAGDELAGRVFSGDGVRCINNLRRIYLIPNNLSGTLNTPVAPSVAVADPAVAGNPLNAGTNRGYYWSYREPVNHCSPFTFNNSNSATITWGP